MANLVFICTTCDRHARPVVQRGAGKRLAEVFTRYLAEHPSHGLAVRQVACLNGCLKPCNVAFRGANRPTLRFSRVETQDVPALALLGARYWAAAEGAQVSSAEWPRLEARRSDVSPRRAAACETRRGGGPADT